MSNQGDMFGGAGPSARSTKAKPLGSLVEAQRVWDAWVKRQKRPGSCIWTLDRQLLVRETLGLGYTAEHLCALVRFAYEADEPGPRWWRGENPESRKYLDLEALLRSKKIGARVKAALDWAAELAEGNAKAIDPSTPAAPNRPRPGLRMIEGGRSDR
jgi:hypothetical protein